MATLKKGSTGKEVNKLQESLNRNKAKPKLKVDGVFGPMTESATREFQKRAKLKPSGQVDRQTWAALDFGGALPVMTVPDQQQEMKEMQGISQSSAAEVKDYAKVMVAANALAASLVGSVPAAMASATTKQKTSDVIAKNCQTIIKKQAEFQKAVLSDPHKAAKLVKECEKLAAANASLISAKFVPAVMRIAQTRQAMEKGLSSNLTTIQKVLTGLRKQGS